MWNWDTFRERRILGGLTFYRCKYILVESTCSLSKSRHGNTTAHSLAKTWSCKREAIVSEELIDQSASSTSVWLDVLVIIMNTAFTWYSKARIFFTLFKEQICSRVIGPGFAICNQHSQALSNHTSCDD